MHITNELDENCWRSFVDQHPASNIFHTPEMFHVFERTRGCQPEVWAAVDDGQILALWLPVQVSLSNGVLRRLTTRSIAYGGALCTPDSVGHTALNTLLNTYKHEAAGKILFAEMRNLSDQSASQAIFTQCGFSYADHLDYLIDLDCSIDQLFQSVGARTRKHIRRELNKGRVEVAEVTCPDQIGICVEVIRRSYQNAHVPLSDPSLLTSAFEVLHDHNMIKFWLARVEAAYVAASVELLFKDVILGWYGGVDRAYSYCTPSELLTWHILNWGCENGYRVYDFGGAGLPDEKYGVRDFKAKFGGQLVCYGRNTWVPNPMLLRASEFGYKFYRRWL